MASCTLIKACEEFGVKLPTIKTDINSKSSSLVASSETKLKVCQKCIEFVKKYVRQDGGYIEMTDGSQIPVSRIKRDLFLQQMGRMNW